jgi:anti-sigma factor RsiW
MEQAHDPAQQLAERYFLGELTDTEAEAFEAHYFDCASCAEYVRETQMLFDVGRAVAHANKGAPVIQIDEVRRRRRQWIPAAVAAMLVIAVAVPLWIWPPAPEPSVESLEPRRVEFSPSRAETDALVFKAGEPILLEIAAPEEALEGDQAGIRNAETHDLIAPALTLTQAKVDGPFLLQPRELPAGRYEVVIERVDGNRPTLIATQPFEVRR